MTRYSYKTSSVMCAIELHRYWAQKYSIDGKVKEFAADGAIFSVEIKEEIPMWEEVCDSFVAGWTASARQSKDAETSCRNA